MPDQTPGEPLDRLLERLGTCATGLSTEEAVQRLRTYGGNTVAGRTLRARVFELARSIANPLVIILLVAGTASAFVREVADAVIIAVIVVLSSGLNAWQTVRSARAVARLQQQIAPAATVLRDQVWRELPRAELVSGDVIRLSAGDMVPADARLIAATDLPTSASSRWSGS